MTTRDEARAALDEYEKHGGIATVSKDLAAALRALLDEPVPTQGKTIADRIAFDAAVNNRAREIVDTRELFAAAQAASDEWEYAVCWSKSIPGYPDVSRTVQSAEEAQGIIEGSVYPGTIVRRKVGPWIEVES